MSDQLIGIVGAGTMGQGIAQVVAASGFTVRLFDVAEEQLGRAEANVDKGLAKLVAKEKITEADKKAALARLSTTTSLQALSDCAVIIEAAPEQPALKECFCRPKPIEQHGYFGLQYLIAVAHPLGGGVRTSRTRGRHALL